MLGHTVSLASGLPLVAVDRRSNTDAFHPEETGISESVRVQTDIASFSYSGSEKAALIAKHLCGHGFDEVLSLATTLGDGCHFLCCAPCCHATMQWELLSCEAQDWYLQIGLPGGADGFLLLTDMIRLARAGDSNACAKWRLKQHLQDEDDASLMGRKACRLIDEGRLLRLETHGISAQLLEYCQPSLSPDNVLLLAWKSTDAVAHRLKTNPPPHAPELPSLCVMIELDPTAPQSLVTRVAAVLLEMKAAESLPFSVTGLADATHVLACNLLVSDPSALSHLLQKFSRNMLFQRVVSRFLPLTESASETSELLRTLADGLTDKRSELAGVAGVAPRTLRVSARPRLMEPELCKRFDSHLLDPVHFTHVLTVFFQGAGPDLRYSLLPRGCFNPSAWSDAKRDARSEASKISFRFLEAGLRFKRLHSQAIVLWRDGLEGLEAADKWIHSASAVWGANTALAELRAVSSSGWAARVAVSSDILLIPIRGPWYPLEDGREGVRGNVLLADTGSTGEEAVLLVRQILRTVLTSPSPALAASGTVVLRLRCGRRPRAVKQWLKEMASMIEGTSEKFGAVELLHLISDRENERTAIFNWSGMPEEELHHADRADPTRQEGERERKAYRLLCITGEVMPP